MVEGHPGRRPFQLSRRSLLGFDGQSNTISPHYPAAYPYVTIAHFGDVYPYVQKAIGGTSFPTRAATAAARVDPLLRQPHTRAVLFSDGGTNDLVADDQTAAQTVARALAYNTARRAAGWGTILGNTVLVGSIFSEAQELRRQEYNAAIVADPAAIGADTVVDWAALPQLQDFTDETWFLFEDPYRIHVTAAAAALIGDLAAAALHEVLPEIPYD